LDIVEEFLVRGDVDEAYDLAKHLVGIFTIGGSDIDAAVAYGQLREAVDARAITPGLVRSIRIQLGLGLVVEEDRKQEPDRPSPKRA
jgi:hypothetical protein